MKNYKKEKKILIVLEDDLHKKIKILSIKKDTTIKELVLNYIKEMLEKEKE